MGILCFLSLAEYSSYLLGAKYFILKLREAKHELASEEKGRKGSSRREQDPEQRYQRANGADRGAGP